MKNPKYGGTVERSLSEKEFQRKLVKAAKKMGWMVFHPVDPKRSEPGFPDLVLVRAGRIILAELKTREGKLTASQSTWLLEAGGHSRLWRPEDWSDILKDLARRR